MSVEQVTSGNLRRTQAFDKELRSLANIDAIADEMADAILFEQNPGKRKTKIGTLVDRLVKETETKVFPQAEKIGRQNAIDILSKTPDPIDLNDPQQRAAALFQGRQRYATRLTMVRDAVTSNGSTLDSALTRYWLEPSEGDAKGKVERLRQIHNTLEKKRKAWETDMRRFTDGEIKTRPSEPHLNFLSAMTAESKKDIRTQARRAGTDAEIAMFSAKGYAKFIWVTPNGASACPDCRNRQSVILTVAEWERIGRPGSGRTVCGAHCFCMLVPAEAVSKSSALLTGKHTKEPGPLTSPDDLVILNANRAVSVPAAKAKLDKPSAKAAKIAKLPDPKPQTAKEWVESLTKKERTGINRFQGGHFGQMRDLQAGRTTAKQAGQYISEAVEGMDSALEKSPNWEGVSYRGLKIHTDTELAKFKAGNSITLDAHSSFTTDEKVAIRFSGIGKESATHQVVLVGKMKTGVDIRPIDDFEQEIVGRKGQRFIVTNVVTKEVEVKGRVPSLDYKAKITYVEMEESPIKARLAQIKKERASGKGK